MIARAGIQTSLTGGAPETQSQLRDPGAEPPSFDGSRPPDGGVRQMAPALVLPAVAPSVGYRPPASMARATIEDR